MEVVMTIKVFGARQNNLKDITVSIPRNKLVAITGVSGSGKSTLAYDTIFAEAQREFLESLSTYAQRGLARFSPTNVDRIEGLSPCIVIDQHPLASNPRSTIGTFTEVYTYLRLLFSLVGKPTLNAIDFSFNTPNGACRTCKGLGIELVPDVDRLINWNLSLSEGAIRHHNWAVGSRNWNLINSTGRFDMNKPLSSFKQDELDLLLHSNAKIYESNIQGYKQTFTFEGVITKLIRGKRDSSEMPNESRSSQFFSMGTCNECHGARINQIARNVLVEDKSIVDLVNMEVRDLLPFIATLQGTAEATIIPFVKRILENMIDLGLDYLSLNRSIVTLSSGESQRLKLTRQLGSKLTEMIYILDEPTSGLHARDVDKLIQIARQLVNKPNTVIVVEHDKKVILSADHVIDLGPGAGSLGGNVIAQGTPGDIILSKTITGLYLSGDKNISQRQVRRLPNEFLEIKNAHIHNLKNLNVKIPKNVLTIISGVSGSGKSSLIEELINKYPNIVAVDQASIGTSARSIPATYLKVYDDIRDEFAQATGQDRSLFSFNGSGACEGCNGLGYQVTDMHFLGDVYQVCKECNGSRFKPDILKSTYKGKNIADILNMSITDASSFFRAPKVSKKLGGLASVGLGYLQLGQPLDTLSGGEAQRLKLASRLTLPGNIYTLDEPSRGLHLADIDLLMGVLNKMVDKGNTIIVVEHNLDFIKNADWIIDLGPDGGERGGEIVAQGTPETIMNCSNSYTGRYLQAVFQ